MQKHLISIIKDFNCVPKRLQGIISQYIMFLMLKSTRHDLRTASRIFGTHESNYSRMLSGAKTRQIARLCLNRAIRRRIAKINPRDEIYLAIDATFTSRSGKKIENKRKFDDNLGNEMRVLEELYYHSGNKSLEKERRYIDELKRELKKKGLI